MLCFWCLDSSRRTQIGYWEMSLCFLKGVLSQLVPENGSGQTHIKASKYHNNVVGEERLAHIRTIVVSLGGKLTYLFICPYRSASPKVWCDFWSVNLFCCWWPWFVVCGFVEILGLVDAFFVVYGIFGCLWVWFGHWVGMKITMAHEGNVSEKPMMGM
jgi:hypothetical protein